MRGGDERCEGKEKPALTLSLRLGKRLPDEGVVRQHLERGADEDGKVACLRVLFRV